MVVAGVPRATRDTSDLQRTALTEPRQRAQVSDEVVLGCDERSGGVVGGVSGSCACQCCKSPIAFPSDSEAPWVSFRAYVVTRVLVWD